MAEGSVNTPDPGIWWTHRRRHSYLSLCGLFALPILAVVLDEGRLSAARPLLETLAWVFGAIIMSYVAAATWEDVVKIRGMK
ncbi:hypothetical protein [Geoalkalibacter sp.]|uniref:hypothetical protein n=1 Tax=Geoalkalibacter sp. TaxID=3041440 RepID=UPI00272E5156|nr:hypothetical protein [Geoalkalibacter sp.]